MQTKFQKERARSGWTLEQVAEKAGVSAAQVNRIEKNGVAAAAVPARIQRMFGKCLSMEDICLPHGIPKISRRAAPKRRKAA